MLSHSVHAPSPTCLGTGWSHSIKSPSSVHFVAPFDMPVLTHPDLQHGMNSYLCRKQWQYTSASGYRCLLLSGWAPSWS